MREHQSVIGQSVGHHIILAVDVVHRPMNPALSKGVTEGDAGSKVTDNETREKNAGNEFRYYGIPTKISLVTAILAPDLVTRFPTTTEILKSVMIESNP